MPTFEELPPVTVEEYDALRENIPVVKFYLHVVKSSIQLQLADHRITGLPRQRKYMENRVRFVKTLLFFLLKKTKLQTICIKYMILDNAINARLV